MRHGAATLSLLTGNDLKVTQAMLDHSTLAVTADILDGATRGRPGSS
ncbi:hypothetical protein IQ251_06820 [Saccharopolyspora sp. HNM0983]|uniref:Tyr recombinase domain-containing protein n=1 Tax=Saccharopolyspora montiporae TaxID=2781240 RepID=A0A929B6J4_9PSEU|nr:hypothetical protein [Saccharopolyspora sp. HNM0983]MBE9374159.1 hypothetical protein [Saccharopolyspora sp. HNM0983]